MLKILHVYLPQNKISTLSADNIRKVLINDGAIKLQMSNLIVETEWDAYLRKPVQHNGNLANSSFSIANSSSTKF